MDAFYASVEQIDNPALKGKPVIVGGRSDQRGVVSAASYEARKYGVHSAMPLRHAYKLCPQAVFLPVNFGRYEEVSGQIMAILGNYTPSVEPVSLDEAFLDVTGCQKLFGSPAQIGMEIKKQIKDTLGLTASVGVAPNMFLSKIASDLKKPDGFVAVKLGEERMFLENLPISKMWGVGIVTEKELTSLGIETIGQLATYPMDILKNRLGDRNGEQLYKLARGIDEREVTPESQAKSIGNEITYPDDTGSENQIRKTIFELSEQVGRRLRDKNLSARTVTLKVRFSDFETITRSKTIPEPTNLGEDIFGVTWRLFKKVNINQKLIRLVGVSTSGLIEIKSKQLSFFEEENEKKERLVRTLDKLRDKMGESIVKRGSVL